jgi:hypothetical protein
MHYFDPFPLGYYGTGNGDPGWYFATFSDKGRGKSRTYTCQSFDEIKALPVGDLFLPKAALARWARNTPSPRAGHKNVSAPGVSSRRPPAPGRS